MKKQVEEQYNAASQMAWLEVARRLTRDLTLTPTSNTNPNLALALTLTLNLGGHGGPDAQWRARLAGGLGG